jgi:phosphoribosyl 1,2-cyclic phosphodiesterase
MMQIISNSLDFFVDCGIKSNNDLIKTFSEQEIDIKSIKYIFITHSHGDHIASLKYILANSDPLIILSKETYNDLKDKYNLIKYLIIEEYKEYTNIDNLKFIPIKASHDCYTVGYIFYLEGKKIVLLTDTGIFMEENYQFAEGADAYLLEANYCPYLLNLSHRPLITKNRIESFQGHLSNEDAAYAIKKLVNKETYWITLHISRECNSKESIERALVDVLSTREKKIFIKETKKTQDETLIIEDSSSKTELINLVFTYQKKLVIVDL